MSIVSLDLALPAKPTCLPAAEPLRPIAALLPLVLDPTSTKFPATLIELIDTYAGAPERIADIALELLRFAHVGELSDGYRARIDAAMYSETIDLTSKFFRFIPMSDFSPKSAVDMIHRLFKCVSAKTAHIALTSHFEVMYMTTGINVHRRYSWATLMQTHPELAQFLKVSESPHTAQFERVPEQCTGFNTPYPSVAPLEIVQIHANDPIAHLRPQVLPQPISKKVGPA